MVSLNKSFLWGIIFASFTWTTSLYLYWQLSSSNTNIVTTTFISPAENYQAKNAHHKVSSNDIDDISGRQKLKGWKDRSGYKRAFFKKYYNSEKLVKSLQPVLPEGNTLEDPSKLLLLIIFNTCVKFT